MGTIFKVFAAFVTILLLFWFLALRHVGSYLPRQGSNPRLLLRKVQHEPRGRQGSPHPFVC